MGRFSVAVLVAGAVFVIALLAGSLRLGLRARERGVWGGDSSFLAASGYLLPERPPWPDLLPLHEAPWPEAPADDRFARDAARGARLLRREGLVIACLARDLEAVLPFLERTVQGIRLAIGQPDVGVVVVENDSEDRTGARLRQWADVDDRVRVFTLALGWPPAIQTANRTERLADLRNRARHEADRLDGVSRWLLMMDADFPRGWNPLGLCHARAQWTSRASWVAANGVDWKHRYYDLFALRDASWTWRGPNGLEDEWNQRHTHPGLSPSAAETAFGGAALYLRDGLGEWDGTDGRCEHWGVRGRGGIVDAGWWIPYDAKHVCASENL